MKRLLPLLPLAFLSAAAHAVRSTFDAGAEGWRTCNVDFVHGPTTVGGFEDATYDPTGGNPGGSLLRAEDAAGANDWRFFAAPAAFLGDQSASLGSTLTFDAFTTASDGVAYPSAILRSGSVYAYCLALPPTSAWSTQTVALEGFAWNTAPDGAGSALTDAALGRILSNLDGLYLDADWYGLPSESAGLDNVALNANPVPEPGSFVVLALAAGATLRRRRG